MAVISRSVDQKTSRVSGERNDTAHVLLTCQLQNGLVCIASILAYSGFAAKKARMDSLSRSYRILRVKASWNLHS